jgi:general secretion pathway protein H
MKMANPFLPARSHGFTLFEIIVVVFIIGVIVTFASLSITQHSDRYVEDEARRIHHLVRLATEEAVLSAQELSFLINNKGYSFAQLAGAKWEPIEGDSFFRKREFPENLEVKMLVYEQEVNLKDPGKPVQIYILSSGEVTPFTLILRGESEVEYTVAGSLTGQITYQQPETKDEFGG